MKIIYSRSVLKFLKKIKDKNLKNRLRESINKLTKQPPEGDIKNYEGEKGTYRLRLNNWRILFRYQTIDGQKYLVIDDIGKRGEIYKRRNRK